MRVVLDARWIGEAPSGVGVYTTELLRRLPALSPDTDYHVLFAAEARRAQTLQGCGLSGNDQVTSEILPYDVFSPEGQWRLPRRLRELRTDVFHTTNYMLPYLAFPRGGRPGGCGRCVTTIHDVIPLLVRDHAPRSRKTRMLPLFRQCLRQSVMRASAVITVSGTARLDMVRALALDDTTARRVHVVYNGVDERFQPARSTATRDPGRPRTLLYVGRLDPYKQVVTLVRAFALLRRQMTQPLHLLIVGPDDPRYPEARQMVSSLDLGGVVTFLGYVSPDQLVAAYQESDVLVNPSSYEGFGLPLVEAMRCGVPVVCGDGGSQPEIAADAALVVPAGDAHALAEAIQRVLGDEALRASLIARGIRRAAAFSWAQTAAGTLSIYRRILGTGGES